MARSRTVCLTALLICIIAIGTLYGGGACNRGTSSGADGTGTTATLSMAALPDIRTALGANNPHGMVPGAVLGAITLPACTLENGEGDITHALANLPGWLSFDPSTRGISLASGVPALPAEANTAAEVTYTCMLASDESVTDAETFTINDLDGGGVIDGFEYMDGAVPLVIPTLGWVRLNPTTVDLYRTAAASLRKIPTGITKAMVGMNPANAEDDAADFDGDEKNNRQEVDDGTNIFVAASDGEFVGPSDIAVGSNSRGIIAADLDGNGNLDLIAADGGNNAATYLGNGFGEFTHTADRPTGAGPLDIAAADFNGDGKIDIATANSGANTVSVLLGNGDGTLKAKNDYAVGTNPSGLTAADLDGDGDVDLAATNRDDHTVSVLLNQGDGTFPPSSPSYATAIRPSDITVADVDGDGDLDLAAATWDGKSVSILTNSGGGLFTMGGNHALGGEGSGITAGDFDGDGDMDIATANYGSTESASVLLNNGDGSFAAHTDYPLTDYKPTNLITADFNGDGDIDLAVTGTYSKKLAVLQGDGNGNFGTVTLYGTDMARWGLVAGDFDDDGDLDVATTSSAGANYFIQVFHNQ